jgi:DNA helicase-2/ATP-dependent DNA helicase PcrA
LAGGRRRSDIAVFYRTNAQSRVLEDAFRRENIPYTLVGSVRFYERMEVKDVLAYLRAAVNPADSVAVKRVINVPARGVGKTTIESLDRTAAARGVSFYEAAVATAQNPEAPAAVRGNLTKFLDILKGLREAAPQSAASALVQRVLEDAGYWAHWEAQTESDPEAAHQLVDAVIHRHHVGLYLVLELTRQEAERLARLDNGAGEYDLLSFLA